MFTCETILQKPFKCIDASKTGPHYRDNSNMFLRPFLAGQIYLVKYMGLPTICTILARTETDVVWFGGTVSVDVFNSLIICYLGHRSHVFGIWLPWAKIAPTLLVNDLPEKTSNSRTFWRVTRSEIEV